MQRHYLIAVETLHAIKPARFAPERHLAMRDKATSLAISAMLGIWATTLAGLAGLKFVAVQHHATIAVAWRFAWSQPFARWPIDMLGAGIVTFALGFALAALAFWFFFDTKWSNQNRDPASTDAANDLLCKSTRDKSRIFSGTYAGKRLYVGAEDRGLVVGPPGTGKTTFLLNQILRAMTQNMSFIAIDIKPELHKTLSTHLDAAGYRVVRVNPACVDAGANHWNPLDDCADDNELSELCSALLPIRDARETPFVESQRDWIKAAVYHAKSQAQGSLPSAFEFLSAYAEPSQLLAVLMKSPSAPAARLARRLTAGLAGQKPDPLILQGLTGALRALDFLSLSGVQSSLGHSDFSAQEIGNGARPVALFLQFEEAKLGALGPLLAFMATAMLTTLINTAGNRKPVALFLDELGNMPPIPGLLEKLNTIRSRQIPTWMYFQTKEQMNRRYGDGADSVFFASADVQIFFRLNDADTRDLVSRLIGTAMKEQRSHSTASGRTSVSVSKRRENVMEPHELGLLKAGEVVCLYKGAIARGYGTPHFVDFPQFKRNG